ncbi:glycoside hydrolase family 13 protein [Hortaea werneckii]|nr:glycoside hydrolase family 13 protein [Hortaea werneckii]KAI7307309.1 glycoside hydrolase family 13 protein [Hortaea werneckii]
MSWLSKLQKTADKHLDKHFGPKSSSAQSPPTYHSSAAPPPIPQRPREDGENELLLQTFEWHTPSQPPAPNETHSPNSHYARLTRIVPSLASLGVTGFWLPPGCKANEPSGAGNGYDCYDIWDLGEFDQKFTRSVKWGSREELNDLLQAAKQQGVEIIWDSVLNHKTAGDGTEETWAVEVDGEDRRVETCSPKKIEAWLKYDFPGRASAGMKYSKMRWRAEHFNGTDWDQSREHKAIYKLIDDPASFPKPGQESQQPANSGMNRLARFAGKISGAPQTRPGKGWAEDVDDLHGNFDYLMFSNIDHRHPEVQQELKNWGEWMLNDTGVDGFRLDAVQHFSFNFSREWISHIQQVSQATRGKGAMVIGEVWTGEVWRILKWLDSLGQGAYAYDAPLLYNFSRISEDVRMGSPNADLRTIARDSLVEARPQSAVTIVTNHDTQPGQAVATPIMPELKTVFYAFTLLRQEGVPCVFWGDLYGIRAGPSPCPPACMVPASDGTGMRSLLPDLMLARRLFAYGPQKDYWDAMSCIGFTRQGSPDKAGSGCAVIMSIGEPIDESAKENEQWTQKGMEIGQPGEIWVDILGEPGSRAEVQIGDDGWGLFTCKEKSVGVFVRQDAAGVEKFPTGFNVDVYTQ